MAQPWQGMRFHPADLILIERAVAKSQTYLLTTPSLTRLQKVHDLQHDAKQVLFWEAG